jgi:hypothetical protein
MSQLIRSSPTYADPIRHLSVNARTSGDEQPVVVDMLGAGVVFEGIWYSPRAPTPCAREPVVQPDSYSHAGMCGHDPCPHMPAVCGHAVASAAFLPS